MQSESRSATERRLTLLGYGAYGLLGWTSVLLPSLIGEIQRSFDRSDADFGVIYFLAALMYGLGGLGGGFLTERIGPRLVLAAAFILLGVTLFGGSVLTVWVLFAATVSIGKAANGSLDAGFGALFLDVFADRRGSALSLLHLCYAVGALLAPLAIGIAVSLGVNWRVIFGLGIVGAAAGLASLLRLDWSSIRHTQHTSTADIAQGGIWGPQFIFLAATMTLYEAQVVGITAWIVRYLEDDGIGIATLALSAFWVGVCISRFIARWLATLATPAQLGFILLTGTTILFLGALLSPWTAVTLILLVAAGFFSGPIYPLLIAIGGDFFPDRLGRMSGGMTAAATLGALTYPPMIGFIAEAASLRTGLLIAAAFGFPALIALALAVRMSKSAAPVPISGSAT